jgi:MFS transporter, ACS family, aldohexuronate transporter
MTPLESHSWKIPNLRWIIAGLVFLNTVINYLDRQTLSIVAPRLTRELHMSDVQYAHIVEAFLVAYTVMYLGSGIAIDRWGVKRVYALATVWWSAAEVLHAFAKTPFFLGVARLLLGIGESANFVAAGKIASEWFPPKDRGTMSGLVQAGAVVGAVLTPPIVLWLMFRWSWRVAFVLTGLVGFVWVVFWWWLYDSPEKSPHITAQERELIQSGVPRNAPEKFVHIRYWDLLKMPTTLGLLVARLISDPVWWFYLFWLPKYLTEARSLTMLQMGYVIWIPYLASDVGAVFGGYLSGVLIARGWEVLRARRIVMLVSALAMPIGILAGFVASSGMAVALISLVLFAHMSWKTNLATLSVDLYPRPVVGRISGIVATGSGAGGALFTSVAAGLIATWSYRPVFFIMGFLHILGFLIVLWLVRRPAIFSSAAPSEVLP